MEGKAQSQMVSLASYTQNLKNDLCHFFFNTVSQENGRRNTFYSFYEGSVMIIRKPDQVSQGNCRLISLLNIDTKITNKTLLN